MVVDATIQKWVTLVAREEAGPEGFGWSVQWIATIFYVDNGIFTSPRPARLQVVLNIRTGLFNQVCLSMNITKNRGDGLPTTPNGGQELGGYIKR